MHAIKNWMRIKKMHITRLKLEKQLRRDGDVSVAQTPPATSSQPATKADYLRLANEVEDNLHRHVFEMFFPRCVDEERGGFHEHFDEHWEPLPQHTRSLVFQSRLTWIAAQAAMLCPDNKAYGNWVQNGLHFLNGAFRDKEYGGLYWSLGEDGAPSRHGEKYAYGMAFAIYASAACYQLSGNEADLELAKHCFQWLEEHAHDAKQGGYFEVFSREGHPVHSSPCGGRDALDVPYGLKSYNAHLHLLEAFTELYRVWPEQATKQRLEELLAIMQRRILSSSGDYCELFFTREWRALSDSVSYGHDVEAAYLLTAAATALGTAEDNAVKANAKRLVDHALEYGWDRKHSGFFVDAPLLNKRAAKEKVWWAQAEGLNALLLMHTRYGIETPRYWKAFEAQWDFIQNFQIDKQHSGWLPRVRANGDTIPDLPKTDGWTEGYHQARALMNVAKSLKRLASRE